MYKNNIIVLTYYSRTLYLVYTLDIYIFELSFRLIEPSNTYPIIEIEVVLNFFPGDHFTAEKYKAFVNQMTKTHSNKDQRITIDDYFHVEDHREWTFFIGKEDLITPWWDKDAAKIPLSCIFLMGWPFRMAYEGRIAKHQVGTLLLN
jgi:hypothetical protein